MRSRAPLSLPTSLAFSYSAKAPAIWRIILRLGSSLAGEIVAASSDKMDAPRDEQRDAELLRQELPGKAVASRGRPAGRKGANEQCGLALAYSGTRVRVGGRSVDPENIVPDILAGMSEERPDRAPVKKAWALFRLCVCV